MAAVYANGIEKSRSFVKELVLKYPDGVIEIFPLYPRALAFRCKHLFRDLFENLVRVIIGYFRVVYSEYSPGRG